ncbi:MAG: flagellin [Pseudomonadota bacterium]
MQVANFPDVRKFSALRDRGAEIKRDLSVAFQELTTGRVSQAETTRNLNGRLGDAHLLRRELDQIEVKKSSFSLALGRASIAQNSLDQVIESIGSLPEDLRAAASRGDEISFVAEVSTAQSSLDQVVSALNVRQGRRFLFSGDAVDRPPLADSQTIQTEVRNALAGLTTAADIDTALDTFFGPGGDFETTIYNGGSGSVPSVELDIGDRVGLEPRADNQAFRDVIRGLAVASVVNDLGLTEDERLEVVRGSGDSLVSGISATSQAIAEVGLSENRIITAQSRLNAEESVMNEAYNAVAGRDPFDAASRAQELEVLLQTTYSVTARLSALNFNNFIG